MSTFGVDLLNYIEYSDQHYTVAHDYCIGIYMLRAANIVFRADDNDFIIVMFSEGYFGSVNCMLTLCTLAEDNHIIV